MVSRDDRRAVALATRRRNVVRRIVVADVPDVDEVEPVESVAAEKPEKVATRRRPVKDRKSVV